MANPITEATDAAIHSVSLPRLGNVYEAVAAVIEMSRGRKETG